MSDHHDPETRAPGRTPNRARRVAAATAVAAGVALTGAIAVSASDSNDTASTTDAGADTATGGLPSLDATGSGQMPAGDVRDGEFGRHGGPPTGDWAGEDATSARPAMPDAGGQLGAPDAASQGS